MNSSFSRLFLGSIFVLGACNMAHHAPVRAAELPPLAPTVLHASRLWIDVAERLPENDCVSPANARLLCFDGTRSALAASLSRSLWSSFPGVEVMHGSKAPPAGDYVLHIDLDLEAVPPDASSTGWSAGARGTWRLERGGEVLAGERVASRSRAEFPYGASLGAGASEVIDAIAVRIGMTLGGVAETRSVQPVPLPAVASTPLEPTPTSESPAPLNAPIESAISAPAAAPPAEPNEPAASVELGTKSL